MQKLPVTMMKVCGGNTIQHPTAGTGSISKLHPTIHDMQSAPFSNSTPIRCNLGYRE